MLTKDIFVIETETLEKTDALEAFAKALKLKFKVTKNHVGDAKEQVLENINKGFQEVKLIEEGKLKPTTAKDFLNEL